MAGPINDPAGFVPLQALAFGSDGAAAVPVDPANPLPVTMAGGPAAAALSGTAEATGIVGPFVPTLGLPVWLTLSGTWSGIVQVLRSVDGGATMLPLTAGGAEWASFAANAQEIVAVESAAAATYHLAITIASGSVGYRVAQ